MISLQILKTKQHVCSFDESVQPGFDFNTQICEIKHFCQEQIWAKVKYSEMFERRQFVWKHLVSISCLTNRSWRRNRENIDSWRQAALINTNHDKGSTDCNIKGCWDKLTDGYRAAFQPLLSPRWVFVSHFLSASVCEESRSSTCWAAGGRRGAFSS